MGENVKTCESVNVRTYEGVNPSLQSLWRADVRIQGVARLFGWRFTSNELQKRETRD